MHKNYWENSVKKSKFLLGAASLSLVAAPLLTTNLASAVGTINRATQEDVVVADITNDQAYQFTGSYAKTLISKIHDANDEAGQPDETDQSDEADQSDETEYCSYVVDDEFVGEEGDDDNDPYLCFLITSETEGSEAVTLYLDNLVFDEVRSANVVMFVYDEITSGAVVNSGSDVVLVGDPDELDHAYAGTSDVTITTHVVRLNVYYGDGYALIDGDGQTWSKGSEGGLTFHATGSFEDDYTGILVDGEEVDDDSHEDSAGSVIVALKANYLDSLSTGGHTLTIVYENGEVEANFTVEDNPDTLDTIKAATTGLMGCVVVLFAIASFGVLAKRR